MENKQYPNQEPEFLFPEDSSAPVQESEEILMIEELNFAEAPVP